MIIDIFIHPIYIIFILFSLPILYHDIKYQDIPDRFSLPAIGLLILFHLFLSASIQPFLIAAAFVLVVFLIPLFFGMDFGGGDLRYGVMSALVVGFPGIAYWMILSAVIHLIILGMLRKTIFGFAPAMFLAVLILPFLPI